MSMVASRRRIHVEEGKRLVVTRNVAAVDLGAESGRVILARFDGQQLDLQVVHRFPNRPSLLGYAGSLGRDADRAAQSAPDGGITRQYWGRYVGSRLRPGG